MGKPVGERPLVVVVSGPSGSGKSTLLTRLFKEYPDHFGYSVSHTTRSPRPGEVDGQSYHFVKREEFLALIGDSKFIEYAEFSSNLYGTSVKAVKDVEAQSKLCILDIELQGVKNVKAKRDELDSRFLFIAPPSLAALEERLRKRATESEEAIRSRLQIAEEELTYARQPGAHDLTIVNDDLEVAYEQFKAFILDVYNSKYATRTDS